MNQEKFLEMLASDPKSRDPDFLAQAEKNDENRELYQQALAFEDSLLAAFNTPVPVAIEETMLDITKVSYPRFGKKTIGLLALAASLVISVSLVLFTPPPSEQLAYQQLVAHISEHDPRDTASLVPVSKSEIEPYFIQKGIELGIDLDDLTYITFCPVGDKQGIHFVLDKPEGLVTVIFVPDMPASRVQDLQKEGIPGLLAPVLDGSAAIVGQPGQDLYPIANTLRKGLHKI